MKLISQRQSLRAFVVWSMRFLGFFEALSSWNFSFGLRLSRVFFFIKTSFAQSLHSPQCKQFCCEWREEGEGREKVFDFPFKSFSLFIPLIPFQCVCLTGCPEIPERSMKYWWHGRWLSVNVLLRLGLSFSPHNSRGRRLSYWGWTAVHLKPFTRTIELRWVNPSPQSPSQPLLTVSMSWLSNFSSSMPRRDIWTRRRRFYEQKTFFRSVIFHFLTALCNYCCLAVFRIT